MSGAAARRGAGRLVGLGLAFASGARRALARAAGPWHRLPRPRRHLPLVLSVVVALLCAALVLAGLHRTPATIALGGDVVRVRLESVRGEQELEFTGADLSLGGQHLGSPVRLSRRNGSLHWQAEGRSGTTPLPCDLEARGQVALARRKGARQYPVPLRFTAGNDWTVVAQVPLEDYVAGVVAAELGPRFASAALAAQAVAARSFAASYMGPDNGRDHHLLDTTRAQVFAGLAVDPACRNAALATGGLVLTGGGRVLRAYYSSTCGGATAAAREKFGDVPAAMFPCQPCDDCRISPVWRWHEDNVSPAELLAALPAVRAPVTAIEPEVVDAAGRWLKARVQGQTGSATLPAWDLRRLLHLRSDFLDSVQAEGGRLRVQGRGFGHGVGLCQYGAEGMARRGADWRTILARYYPGATLVPVRAE